MNEVARWACKGEGIELLKKLLAQGLTVNDEENGGSSTVREVLTELDWTFQIHSLGGSRDKRLIDNSETRDKMTAIRLLIEHGARWVPKDQAEINAVRRSLLKLTPEYTAELVLIMTRHRACEKACLEDLLRTPTIKTHMSKHSSRIMKLLASWK